MKSKLQKIIILSLIILTLPSTSVVVLAKIPLEGYKALKNHPEFVNIEKEGGEKLGGYLIVNFTENRSVEFSQIDYRSGGGKYACLRRIGEFELRGSVNYPKDTNRYTHSKECYGSYARFCDLSQAMGVKIETMVDVIDHYDEILAFVKMIATEQYISDDYVYHVDTEDRKATIWVWKIHGYSFELWHGVKEGELPPYNEYFGPEIFEVLYGENWREKLNADLPKIRKSLGLE